VRAAPIEDDLELLRTRPTGMDEKTWRAKRREVAAELGKSRSKDAVDALIEIVETERYDSVLSIAIEGLGEQGDPRAIPSLQKIYRDRSIDTFVREQAGEAIVKLGGTPADDARLAGGAGTVQGEADLLTGPQLGTMGEASVEPEPLEELGKDAPLPDNLRARARDFGFVLGTLDLDVDTRITQQPVLADAGLGAYARYLDERQRWGWTVRGTLDGRVANGDITSAPSAGAGDDGDVLFISERLGGDAEAHVYFGRSDFHAFAGLGLEQRLLRVGIEDLDGGNESSLTDTRLSLDVIPAGGIGWGRHLDAGSDLMVDAIVEALETENILAKPLDPTARKAIRDAVYRRANAWSTWPRVAAVLAILEEGGFLARRAGARLVHRLRSVLEDPSLVGRPKGILVRAGFLYDAAILQSDYLRRGDGVGAPFLQLVAGFPVHRERQIDADARFWYDAIGETGFTLDAGALYTRFFHTKFDDYRGAWFTGLRGGISHRELADLPDDVDPRIGYRGVGTAGYAYGWNRGSEIRVSGTAGVDSGGFVASVGLGLRFGLVRASVLNGATSGAAAPPAASTSASAGTPAAPSR
jgi:hypothetical protein